MFSHAGSSFKPFLLALQQAGKDDLTATAALFEVLLAIACLKLGLKDGVRVATFLWHGVDADSDRRLRLVVLVVALGRLAEGESFAQTSQRPFWSVLLLAAEALLHLLRWLGSFQSMRWTFESLLLGERRR